MILIKYGGTVTERTLSDTLSKINNQLYKILCFREEKREWIKPLQTILYQITGLESLLETEISFLTIMSKLEFLIYSDSNDFLSFRRTIFECMGLIEEERNKCKV